MTKIIGLSGKKQSGKNTVCDAIYSHLAYRDCSCKIYSFADTLKEKICIDVLGLTKNQCYGSDEQKNSLTIYKWENLPHQVRYDNKLGYKYASNGEVCEHILPKGFMTAREIMQIVGTDIFRKMFNDKIWVNATFRNIKKEGYDIALIADVRFPSEVEGVMNEEGKLIRLTRDTCKGDQHESELALDNYNFKSYGERVYELRNEELSIEEQNKEALKQLAKWLEKKEMK